MSTQDNKLRCLLQRHVLPLVLGGMALLGGTPALAQVQGGTRVLEASVTALQAEVSLSRSAATAYVGYQVSLRNAGGNTLNNVVFTATSRGPSTAGGPGFHLSEGLACTASADRLSVSCPVGQLRAGASAAPFVLFFVSPSQAGGQPPVCTDRDCVELNATVYYAEGTGGLETSVPQNSAQTLAPVQVTLGTDNPVQVKTAVPRGGATLFTGDGVPKANDPLTTRVAVPPLVGFTTASITEVPASGCTNVIACLASDIRIPGTFTPYLRITLRQDAANLRPGTRIGSVLIEYTSDLGVPMLVGWCPAPGVPLADRPCIESATAYRKATTNGVTELEGDFEWVMISPGNGSYKIL